MKLSDLQLGQLAALLAPAGAVIDALELAPPLPDCPATGDLALWRTWLAALPTAQLADLLEELPANPEFTPLIAVLRLDAAPQPAPAAAAEDPPHVVLRGTPVVDRRDIWAHLRALHRGDKRILQVRGGKSAGKTHVRWLVHEQCNRFGRGHEVRYTDLDGAKALRHMVTGVLAGLPAPALLADNEFADSTPDGWARALARHLFQALVHVPPLLTRWLVFDHFERAQKSTASVVFFAELAQEIALAAYDPNLDNAPRLVLIDHGVDLPEVATPFSLEAEVRPVTLTDIESFVRQCRPGWTAEAQKEARRLHDEARDEANQLIAQLRAADPTAVPHDPFMNSLRRKVAALLVPAVPA